jgi:purine-binding chemotaxis protein CheW
MSDKRQYVSCFVDDLMVGIAVDAVQEVTSGSELTHVPLAPPVVSGLLNLRGQIVTTIDLRRCLQLSSRPANQRPVHLILRTDDGCVGLLVDQVGDVLEVDDEDFEAPPETLRGSLRELITGAYKLDAGLLLALDTERALAFSSGEQT